jgi:hypothetical protein
MPPKVGPPLKAASASNKVGLSELSMMPKAKSESVVGPMPMQPIERGSIMPTQGLPMPPAAGTGTKTPAAKKPLTRNDEVRAAKARIMRRSSLQKQRAALKG